MLHGNAALLTYVWVPPEEPGKGGEEGPSYSGRPPGAPAQRARRAQAKPPPDQPRPEPTQFSHPRDQAELNSGRGGLNSNSTHTYGRRPGNARGRLRRSRRASSPRAATRQFVLHTYSSGWISGFQRDLDAALPTHQVQVLADFDRDWTLYRSLDTG